VIWSVTDGESAVVRTCAPTTISADTPSQEVNAARRVQAEQAQRGDDQAGRDRAIAGAGGRANVVLLSGSATASPNATDALSGVASSSCIAPSTASVGVKTVGCTATDNAGNSATASASYTVTYQFVGFSGPVDGGGTLNVVKAGQGVPLKWRLLDAAGTPVTNLTAAAVNVANLACVAGATADELEEYANGGSGLQNLGGGYYQFNWSTPKAYANSCKTMQLNLGEGATHNALFRFTK
jgi:hypothetical protein